MREIDFNGHRLTLLPDRAVLWSGAMVIADPHFGKSATFRRGGIPVPAADTRKDLRRLDGLLQRWEPRTLIVLGDFFHAAEGRDAATLEALDAWRRGQSRLRVVLVRGNHDRHAGDPPPELRIEAVSEPFEADGLTLCHFPPDRPGTPTLAGHLHPVATIRDLGQAAGRLPCFLRHDRLLVLPAFGTFTGGGTVRPAPGRQVFVLTEDEVILLPSSRMGA